MSGFMHELRHGVPEGLQRVSGEGFKLAPTDATITTVGEALSEAVLNLVSLAVVQPAGSTSRTLAVHALAYMLSVYGYTDHDETVAEIGRAIQDHHGRRNAVDDITEHLIGKGQEE